MRTIDAPGLFKRDFKRESKGRHRATLDTDLRPVIDMLVLDRPLAASCRDHGLTGEWADCRECHIKPDLLLIYRKEGDDKLTLVRLGSHSELFG
ncbi:MAG: type II toxin-antitoxin system YafQ family toxin [Gammaproteobacteria bacterium]|nr:type II toxin-antitoxin system YafQ family toxin [Rhodocyclaceae bacterium]MBU3909898.1 type II toxin-antitoxin system YafQ family toxin [Gammaproteobacteria bacterium]MBU3988950.1 type II toxin-antitoxin system YafQ family toxin [Gammaproteobacteria bacterium]MBU4003523.1 type II toxin-antitoxin system YafQ family toxin [Gammaproteobacteria bacterium]MBU4020118.1 type II toxin-antitoxin system YafQ family toxin [Gammaproteobacteria bacterium]